MKPRRSTGVAAPRRSTPAQRAGIPPAARAPRRRVLILATLALALALLLVAAPAALAAAGGGSAGFGGGGGGRGGGAALYILFQILIRVAVLGHGLGALVIVGVILLLVFLNLVAPRLRNVHPAQESRGRTARRTAATRERRVELAAAEAAEEDPAFAPDVVRPAAAQLFADIQAAWDARDLATLRDLVAPSLLEEWERRLAELSRRGWHNRVAPIGSPRVEYVGLRNRGDRRLDRAIVRIDARLRDYVEDAFGRHIKRTGRPSETVRIREFWTLGRPPAGSGWRLVSIEQGGEGAHALEDTIVATPWSDEETLRDEALLEQAQAAALPDDVNPAEVADLEFTGDARSASLDLSLADGRFAPDLLEVAARRAVAAWAEAVDGDDEPLRSIASEAVAAQLLHPGDPSRRTRLVVRGPRIRQIRITRLDAASDPPTMTIEVDLEGRRYVEDRSTTAILAGSPSRPTRFTEHWTLALGPDPAQPWRIVRVGTPVGA